MIMKQDAKSTMIEITMPDQEESSPASKHLGKQANNWSLDLGWIDLKRVKRKITNFNGGLISPYSYMEISLVLEMLNRNIISLQGLFRNK